MWQISGWPLVADPLVLLEACLFGVEELEDSSLSKYPNNPWGFDLFPRQTPSAMPAMTLDRSSSWQVLAEKRASWVVWRESTGLQTPHTDSLPQEPKKTETFLRQASRVLFVVRPHSSQGGRWVFLRQNSRIPYRVGKKAPDNFGDVPAEM